MPTRQGKHLSFLKGGLPREDDFMQLRNQFRNDDKTFTIFQMSVSDRFIYHLLTIYLDIGIQQWTVFCFFRLGGCC